MSRWPIIRVEGGETRYHRRSTARKAVRVHTRVLSIGSGKDHDSDASRVQYWGGSCS